MCVLSGRRRIVGPFLISAVVPLAASLALACGSGSPPSNAPETAGGTPQLVASPGVTPIAQLPDAREFFAQFVDVTVIQEACDYREDRAQVDCGDFGKFGPVPAPVGEEIFCSVLLVDESPIAIACNVQEPPQILYYPVQGEP